MTFEPKPPRSPVSISPQGTSSDSEDNHKAQLSDSSGVQTDVSTAALDRAMLFAATPQMPTVFSAGTGPDSQTDADIMLRVKTGDQSAFEYLVQQYRRPMVSFMDGMARTTAAAEDPPQEALRGG